MPRTECRMCGGTGKTKEEGGCLSCLGAGYYWQDSGQPPPQPSTGDVWLLVVADMEKRRQFGIKKYGLPVQPFNGRDPLWDAYEEVLDLAVYLRQAIEERKGHNAGLIRQPPAAQPATEPPTA